MFKIIRKYHSLFIAVVLQYVTQNDQTQFLSRKSKMNYGCVAAVFIFFILTKFNNRKQLNGD